MDLKDKITRLLEIQELKKSLNEEESNIKSDLKSGNFNNRIRNFNKEISNFERDCFWTLQKNNKNLDLDDRNIRYNVNYDGFSFAKMDNEKFYTEFYIELILKDVYEGYDTPETREWKIIMPFDESKDDEYIKAAKDEIVKYWDELLKQAKEKEAKESEQKNKES